MSLHIRFRLYAKLIGRPCGVDKASMKKLMGERKNLCVVIGGFEEATLHCDTQVSLRHAVSRRPRYDTQVSIATRGSFEEATLRHAGKQMY